MMRPHRMRIAYVNHTGHISGAERVLLDMLTVLDRDQFEPVVLCPTEGGLADQINAMNVSCRATPALGARFSMRPERLIKSIASMLKSIRALRREIRAIRPDLVHANTIRSGIAATFATSGMQVPVVWHIHDILPNHPLSSLIRIVARFSPRTYVVAVSHATAAAFCGRFNFKGRARTIHNGVDLSRFPHKARNISAFREKSGIPTSSFLVCAVGQICERKGLRELIQAFISICGSSPRMHLAIVGDVVFEHERHYYASLLETANKSAYSERLHFTGPISNVSEVYRASDLLVLNSHQEPFGLVLVEALSSGAAVLATRVGGIPETIVDGSNGWLVEKGDSVMLASKLLTLSQDAKTLERAVAVAQATTCNQFSIVRFREDLNRLYSEFIVTQDLGLNAPEQLAYSLQTQH